MNIEEQARQVGYDAALAYVAGVATNLEQQLHDTRNILAVVVREHGPFPHPTEEQIETLQAEDSIINGPLEEDGPAMLYFQSDEDRLGLMQEAFAEREAAETEPVVE